MIRETIDLIERVQTILGTNNEYFDAVKEWYSNVRLAQKAIRLMIIRRRSGARVFLTVNGQLLAADAVTVTPQARHITWVLGSGLLADGVNNVIISLDSASKASLYLQSVTAYQEHGLPRQVLDLSVAGPTGNPCLALTDFADAHHDGGACCLDKNGFLNFRLRLQERAPLTFTLGLPDDGSDAWSHDLDEVMKEVAKRVHEKCRELNGERRRADGIDNRLVDRLCRELNDLEVFTELQQAHIEPALRSSAQATLEQLMGRLGDPDRLVRILRSEISQLVAMPQQFAPVEVVEPSPRIDSRRSSGRSPRANSSSVARVPARTGGGFLKTCFTLLTVVGMLGGAGAAALKYLANGSPNAGPSTVTIDSPTEGQRFAPGMPLQVLVSAKDSADVKSLAVSVEASDPSPVLKAPTPDKVDFAQGTKDTGTRVFTIELNPDALPEAKSVTIVVTAVNGEGKVTTSRRKIMVGGKDPALAVSINPVQPKAHEPVTVTIHTANLPAGTLVSYTWKGTDGAGNAGTMPVNPDGTAAFPIPGGAENVRDDVEVQVVGTDLKHTFSYSFK